MPEVLNPNPKCNGLGLDISNDTIYPKDENGKNPRPDYSFVWQLSIDEDGNATLAKRYTLDLMNNVFLWRSKMWSIIVEGMLNGGK